ncbi:MAG: hypothetical protein ACI8P0_006136, partial [Planctomycetaceae bacterium]
MRVSVNRIRKAAHAADTVEEPGDLTSADYSEFRDL